LGTPFTSLLFGKAGNYEEIRDTLKAWLPAIRILEPSDFRDKLVHDAHQWLLWQASNINDQA
jgi:hypothetical protein